MKTVFLLFLVLGLNLLCGTRGNAQTTDSFKHDVPIVPCWAKGDTFDYDISKTRLDSSNTSVPKKSEQRFLARITIIDSTDSSYRLEYYRIADFPPALLADSIPTDIRQKIQELAQIKITYETNETGIVSEILNQEDLQEKIDQDYHSLLELMNVEDRHPNLTAIIEDFMSSFSAETLINMYAQDIYALHYGLGYEWNTQDTIDFEEELLAPILNVPITANGIFYCNHYDAENNLISLREEKRIVGDYKQDILNFLQQYETETNPISREEFQKLDMNIHIQNTYAYNNRWGIPRLVELHKAINVSVGKEVLHRTEIYRIELRTNLP
ncbi:MAG TPA: hypothetical protein PKA53_00735 [Sphingobacterium sp.]|nr:hypothetical protein [Sphingobacterium sp.]